MNFSKHIRIIKRSFRYLFTLSRSHLFCLILGSIIQNLLPYIPIYFSALLIDALYQGQPRETLFFYAALTVGTVFLFGLAGTWLSSVREKSSGEMYRNLHWDQSEKIMHLAYASIEDPEIARLRSRIAMESQTGYNMWALISCIDQFFAMITRIIMSSSLTMSFFFLKSVPLNLKLGLTGGILATLVCGIFSTRKIQTLTDRYYGSCVHYNLLGQKFDSYREHYSSGKDIRIYNMGESLLAYNADAHRELHKRYMDLKLRSAVLKTAVLFMNHLLRFGIYMTLIYGALSGGITVGSIARYVTCIMLLSSAAAELVSVLQNVFNNNQYLNRYFSFLDIPNPMYQGSLTVEKRDDNEYFVEFRDVSFRYPNTESYALRHVNLKFRIGEKLAIVGKNGSGKTTFIKLMCRLYEPTEGEILLNGVNIKKYDYDEYMSIFSIVFQDFRLFSFRLGENIAASPEYDRKRAEQCLIQAGFGERLAEMPEGTESYLYQNFDKKGIEISGGEGQKIALARALYKDAPFLILDEPTAALDPVSEYEIYSRFNRIAGDKTAIYISHRLASCRFCDKIAVFSDGRIIQTGSHETLISQQNGQYYELWQAQAQYYK